MKADHLRRFLRARRFQVADAFKQFADTEDWRKANHLDTLYETIDQEHYEETRRLVQYPFPSTNTHTKTPNSTPNGPAAAIVVVFPSTSSKSST